ncbi:MAG: bifunctional 5,10-methylenetetrahydrofolate dehydrogenase/5,10-methenyltetrahydrofolate cyclohydrolase [Ignavibacteriales bacterium]
MLGRLIDGNAVSASLRSKLITRVSTLKENGTSPCLATILVGNDPASSLYVQNKQKAAKQVGLATQDHRLEDNLQENELALLIDSLNNDPDVHGILVQLPLPKNINEFDIINKINPCKDVDGLTSINSGLLLHGKAVLKPCTPSGIMELLDYYNIEIKSQNAIIVNRSILVGKPLAFLLLERDATVTICHSKSANLGSLLLGADIIITAIGDRDKFILKAEMVKENAVVIDVGTNRKSGKLLGDVDFESVREKASWITPVPGGVGPMTIAMLLSNTVTAAAALNPSLTS